MNRFRNIDENRYRAPVKVDGIDVDNRTLPVAVDDNLLSDTKHHST